MPISVRCPSCGKGLTVPDHAAGKRGKCPGCQKPVAIPAAGGGAIKAAPARAAAPPMAAAAPAARKSVARPATGAGTSPKTFKKLFMWALLSLLLIGPILIGLGMVMGVLPIIMSFTGKVDKAAADVRSVQPNLDKPLTEDDLKALEAKQKELKNPDLTPEVPWYAYIGFAVTGLGVLVVMFGYLLGYVLIYKEWALIQDGQARTTPMMAIVWLLVPILNIYGIFVGIRGLAEDLNNYAKQRQIQAREVSVSFVTTSLILGLVPCTSGIGLLLLAFVMNSLKNAAVDIASAKYGTA